MKELKSQNSTLYSEIGAWTDRSGANHNNQSVPLIEND